MISHLSLRHWRSYDTLDLDFGSGTTFVVAPNGVGKTSLVLGLASVSYTHLDVYKRQSKSFLGQAGLLSVLPDVRLVRRHSRSMPSGNQECQELFTKTT